MRKAHGELLGVLEVDHFIGPVGAGVRAQKTEGNDLGLGVLGAELIQERNGSSFSVGSSIEAAIEVFASLLNSVHKPLRWLLHAPSVSGVATSDGHLSVVGDIGGELFDHDLVSLLGIDAGAEAHRAADRGGRSEHVSSGLDLRQAFGTSD